jgi:hypothetical protein
MAPSTAGAIAGALGGAMMLATSDALLAPARSLAFEMGRALVGGSPGRPWIVGTGFVIAMTAGAVLGILFGVVARHLRRFAPTLVWSLLFFPAAWTAFHAYVLGLSLPYLPLAAGALAFGLCASLQVPLRVRSVPVWLRVPE